MGPRTLVLLLALGAAPLGAPATAAAKPAATVDKPARASAPATETKPGTKPPGPSKVGKPKLGAKATKKKDPPPCYARAVRFTRQREGRIEERSFPLTFCDGRIVPAALEELSLLGRPRELDALPSAAELRAYAKRPVDRGPRSARRDPGYLSVQVMRLHPDLLLRLQAIADHFPGKTIDIVSGHRPNARSTSRHHHGRALDLRVDGVSREKLRDFARTLENTGVGYYPNSVFVHVDVRDDKGYWVDRSGPGEPPDYGPWPPAKHDLDDAREQLLRDAYGQLAELADFDLWDDSHRAMPPPSAKLPVGAASTPSAEPAPSAASPPSAKPVLTAARPAPRALARPEAAQATLAPSAATRATRPRAREEPARLMTPEEVARIRAEAIKALAKLR